MQHLHMRPSLPRLLARGTSILNPEDLASSIIAARTSLRMSLEAVTMEYITFVSMPIYT